MGSKYKLDSLRQYCEISTFMGVADCYLAKPLLGKLFWGILVIAGISITTWQTYITVEDYLKDDDYKIIVSKELMSNRFSFPNIIVCNYNRARQSIINATDLDPKVLSYLFQLFPQTYDVPLNTLGDKEIIPYQEAWDLYVAKTGENDARDFFRKFAQGSKEMFMQVTIASSLVIKNFTEVFTAFGLCWRVNIDINHIVPGIILVKYLTTPLMTLLLLLQNLWNTASG